MSPCSIHSSRGMTWIFSHIIYLLWLQPSACENSSVNKNIGGQSPHGIRYVKHLQPLNPPRTCHRATCSTRPGATGDFRPKAVRVAWGNVSQHAAFEIDIKKHFTSWVNKEESSKYQILFITFSKSTDLFWHDMIYTSRQCCNSSNAAVRRQRLSQNLRVKVSWGEVSCEEHEVPFVEVMEIKQFLKSQKNDGISKWWHVMNHFVIWPFQ